jgi:hypothetical protein
MRVALAAGALLACACGVAVAQVAVPPMDTGPGIWATDGSGPAPPACPRAGTVVQRGMLPAIEYRGAAPDDPALCLVRIGTTDLPMYFGMWAREWPGSAAARDAIGRAIHGPTGKAIIFDTSMAPGLQWHDVIRNEGLEELNVFGQRRPTVKIAHYREGYGGNTYRSVTTGWKDLQSGAVIYVTYRHISGRPEAGTAWDATGLVEPR